MSTEKNKRLEIKWITKEELNKELEKLDRFEIHNEMMGVFVEDDKK
jgi:hypothetical protein